MSSNRIDHIALHVESLRQAERFYARLFDLEVLRSSDSGAACVLGRGDFHLLLTGDADEPGTNGRLAHIGLQVDDADLDRLSVRALSLGCLILHEGAGRLVLQDVYAVRWHIVVCGTASDGCTQCGLADD